MRELHLTAAAAMEMREAEEVEVERWIDLAPELLSNVVSRVEVMSGEGRRVVAMAGVCRSWRRHILGMNSRSMSTEQVMQFPWMVVRPGPRQLPLQCLLKRKGALFSLFQTPKDDVDGKQHFLLAARRRRLPTGFQYIIGKDPKNLVDKEALDVLGKLKSNFWASEFVLWERRSDADEQDIPVVSLRFVEHIVNGIRQRRIQCAMQQAGGGGGGGAGGGLGLSVILEKRMRRKERRRLIPTCFKSWVRCSCVSYHSRKNDTNIHTGSMRNYSSSRMLEIASSSSGSAAAAAQEQSAASCGLRALEEEDDEAEEGGIDLELRSKVPAWDAQQQCWSLDFKGRATMPSMHNFQLIRSEADASTVDNIILQLGKIGKNVYTMDFCSPLSAFQAFAICLSSFATNAALEP